MKNKHDVLVLGYGEMGHAMQYLLAERHRLVVWDKYPAAGIESVKLEQVVPDADFILFCLPVNPHREMVTRIAPLLKQNSICLSIAKGLDESGQTAAQIFADVLADKHAYVLLYGPMISEEILAGRYAFAQLGCRQQALYQRSAELFSGSRLLLEHSSDINGISWSVILKNVYAMLFGISDELKLGDNMRGFLAVEAIRELDSIVCSMGGDAGSPFHLAGLGDLIATATSENSHHHSLGRQLARGDTSALQGEGVHTLAMVEKHGLINQHRFPLFSLMQAIVRSPVDVESMMIEYIRERC